MIKEADAETLRLWNVNFNLFPTSESLVFKEPNLYVLTLYQHALHLPGEITGDNEGDHLDRRTSSDS